MIPRYTREEMGRVWSDANRFQKWLDVEIAATETLAEAGQVPTRGRRKLFANARRVDVPRIHEIESRVKHDVIAFTMNGHRIHRRSRRRAMAASRTYLQ